MNERAKDWKRWSIKRKGRIEKSMAVRPRGLFVSCRPKCPAIAGSLFSEHLVTDIDPARVQSIN